MMDIIYQSIATEIFTISEIHSQKIKETKGIH